MVTVRDAGGELRGYWFHHLFGEALWAGPVLVDLVAPVTPVTDRSVLSNDLVDLGVHVDVARREVGFWTAATFKGTVDELAGPAVRVLGGPPRGAGAAVRRRVRGVPVPTAPAWTGPLARMAVSTSNRPHRTWPTGILGP